ncbi:MAG TPA: hypothetical protein PLM07_04790 [Candidatus Rifleibacterium sp.]|nr:hypothetical protein [Candidatus Rifleibacterium sp.]HPT45201.1 hypothetical protein [Candidatus Rifleibacterium sp.]
MPKPETHPDKRLNQEEARLEMVLKNTFAALDQLTDLFNKIRSN